MIKINVISSNNNWFDYIRNPNDYIGKKISKLNSRNRNFFKKKHFAPYFFQATKKLNI